LAARKHPAIAVAPTVTVIQLDTNFPRVPGDVGCAETYCGDIEILRVPNATVGQIVSVDPASIHIAPFEEALSTARGDVIVTSCGFLSFWQTHLAARTDRPFISSALTALPELCDMYAPEDILTVAFDADILNEAHFGPHQTDVIGLLADMHLRQVIANNLSQLDIALARQEITDYVRAKRMPHHKHILLECTNLPPYKDAIGTATNLPITDILTCIEAARPNTVRPEFMTHHRSIQ
jgi:hypothetical protein